MSAPRAAVVGWPVAHSLSPALHRYWLRHYGIEGTYEALPVTPDDAAAFFGDLPDSGLAGVNVTIPHKEVAAQAMDRLDPVAQQLGAVNLVTVAQDGTLEGRNTDGFGFIENIKSAAAGFKFAGTVAVYGAGGTTRAVALALLGQGMTVRLVNRTAEKAKAIAAELGGAITVHPWADRHVVLEEASLIVNTTSLGMTGQPPLELNLRRAGTHAIVTDCVYAPLETPLLADARALGLQGIDGLGMLIHQARPAFKAWFGRDPEATDELRAHLIAARKEQTS